MAKCGTLSRTFISIVEYVKTYSTLVKSHKTATQYVKLIVNRQYCVAISIILHRE